jgi:hypothetical protein
MFAFLTRKTVLAALFAAVVILLTFGRASSQTGGIYDLSWNTIDGGGSTFVQGGGYTLGGTTGAADAGAMSGGQYVLSGGFWSGTSDKRFLYLPVTKR